jgi:hypothetical protein
MSHLTIKTLMARVYGLLGFEAASSHSAAYYVLSKTIAASTERPKPQETALATIPVRQSP